MADEWKKSYESMVQRIKIPKNNESLQPRGWYRGSFVATLNILKQNGIISKKV